MNSSNLPPHFEIELLNEASRHKANAVLRFLTKDNHSIIQLVKTSPQLPTQVHHSPSLTNFLKIKLQDCNDPFLYTLEGWKQRNEWRGKSWWQHRKDSWGVVPAAAFYTLQGTLATIAMLNLKPASMIWFCKNFNERNEKNEAEIEAKRYVRKLDGQRNPKTCSYALTMSRTVVEDCEYEREIDLTESSSSCSSAASHSSTNQAPIHYA